MISTINSYIPTYENFELCILINAAIRVPLAGNSVHLFSILFVRGKWKVEREKENSNFLFSEIKPNEFFYVLFEKGKLSSVNFV